MNCLNSLVLEGCVITDVNYTVDFADFGLEVPRFYKNADGKMEEEKSLFTIEVYGNTFVEMVKKHAYKGRGIRLVGRLKQKRWKDEEGKMFSKVVVIAEHIEFRPKTCGKKVEGNMFSEGVVIAEHIEFRPKTCGKKVEG